MKWMRVILAAGLAVLLALALGVALFPARTAMEWLGPRLGGLRLEEVGGTIWNGHAGMLYLRGHKLGRLHWQVHPGSLLQSRLAADLQLEGEQLKGEAEASLSGPRDGHFRQVRLTLPAERLAPLLDIPALTPLGRVELELDEVQVVDGLPRRLNGEAIWRDAAVAGRAAARLGELRAEFASQPDGSVVGVVNDLGGPLELQGSFRLALSGYEAEAILGARDGHPEVAQALGWVGQGQPDGRVVLKLTGQLLGL